MRKVLLFTFLISYSLLISAQDEIPEKGRIPLKIPLTDFSKSHFFYGIKPVSGVENISSGIQFRMFEMISEIGYVKKPYAINYPKIIVGFCGFDESFVSELDTLWAKPSDTTIQSYVHNLLSDVFVGNLSALDVSDPSTCKLLIIDVSNNQSIPRSIMTSENTKKIVFLLKNTRASTEIPESLSNSVIAQMDITRPLRSPRIQAAKTDVVLPGKPEQPAPIISKSNISRGSVESAASLTKAPEISTLFYLEVKSYIEQNGLGFDEKSMKLTLSETSDSVCVINKVDNKILKRFLITKEYTIKFTQSTENRRREVPDPETVALNNKFGKQAIFGYNGQKLYYDNIKKILRVPIFVKNGNELQCHSPISNSIECIKENDKDICQISFNYDKHPLKITVTNIKDNKKIDNFYLVINSSSNPILKAKFNSGNEIPELLTYDSIYTINLFHPEYKKINTTVYTLSSDFSSGKTIQLEYQPAHHIFYVEPRIGLRQQILHCLEQRITSIQLNNQPYLLYITNSNLPIIASDEDGVNNALNRVSELFDEEPNLETDYKIFSDKIKSLEGLTQEKIILHFYMSMKLYQKQGRQFIDKIINDVITGIYNQKNWEVYLYVDGELQASEIVSSIKYHYLNLLKE